jgi:hypothetical protein
MIRKGILHKVIHRITNSIDRSSDNILMWICEVQYTIQCEMGKEHESLYNKCWDFPLNTQQVLSNQFEVLRNHQLLRSIDNILVN